MSTSQMVVLTSSHIPELEKKPPIVFKWPGLKPDICLKVFHQEYHAHSVLLKLHSAFFRSFLDSPDKENLKEKPAFAFRYEWITKVDEDGGWHLVAAPVTPQNPSDFSPFKEKHQPQQRAFEKILRAIHSKPYTVEGCEELHLMIELADYYRCLPMLSYSMDGALLHSRDMSCEISDDPEQTFPDAAKLRNANLFRDVLIHMVNPRNKPIYLDFPDPKLKRAAQRGYDSVARKIADAHYKMATPTPAKNQWAPKPRGPMVFKLAGLGAPDTCLLVFEQKFHEVYGDKVNATSTKGFKYYWVTKIEEDGDWHLVAFRADKDNQTETPPSKHRQRSEIRAFQKLLQAFYVQSYLIYDWEILERMTMLADYYCVLPHLSRTLDGILPKCFDLHMEIEECPDKILPIAAKLRNATLFRECIIWLVSSWSTALSDIRKVQDPKLRKIALNAFSRLAAEAAQVQHEMLDKVGQSTLTVIETAKAPKEDSRVLNGAPSDDSKLVPLPGLLAAYNSRGLFEGYKKWYSGYRLLEDRSILVRNSSRPGEGDLENRFLCAKVDDEDLPWDVNETDW